MPRTILKPVRERVAALYQMEWVEVAPAPEPRAGKHGRRGAADDPALAWNAGRLRGEPAKLRNGMLHAAEERRDERMDKLRERVKVLERLERSQGCLALTTFGSSVS